MDKKQWAIVLAGGDPVRPELVHRLPSPAYVVAADSGLSQAPALGIEVDAIVGDLDSADTAAVAEAEERGVAVHRHPVDKDATDLELALRHVVETGYRRVVLVGGAGGRIDHFLANALVLTSGEFAPIDVEWLVGDSRLLVVRRQAEITGAPGDHVTILAVGGPAVGVETTGLRWSLQAATLAPGSTHGVSNELTDEQATISLDAGTLLIIHTLRQEEPA